MRRLPPAAYRTLLRAALREDLGRSGDLTTRLFVPATARFTARVLSREAGVICGLDVAAAAFRACDRGARVRALVRDGARIRPGQAVMTVSGGRGLLTAERTALNFLQRLSGVATLTRRYADRVKGTRARVLDTRKTLPGWRALDKYAVACGGGVNHRMGLYDAVMVKDNHYLGRRLEAGARELRRRHPGTPLIVECDSPSQIARALALKPDVILLDNMPPAALRRQIKRLRAMAPRVKIEISGGVNLNSVRALAKLGPDRISVGRLTHSAPALDLGLDL
ncbi:MAG: carboxylating nicotinate-nucleotide diphosphorylase [Elusimicrobia bacterium]|nr:carboxylating nicotinate-nucleotide diphosphorylase [Elusimicrobiota bacterium]MDE2511923.1 carboxylating nicotinate-nucleotide diphosphorylase [Elusimicrobiota bacterium]